ncbi:MAG: 3-phytase [Solirubrobacterales bacterium]|jgi:hypothetical protein|nr:3-phytase [Solirubrobacterales bacterium]
MTLSALPKWEILPTSTRIVLSLAALALLASPAEASASDRYVDNSGSDTANDCQAPASPCASIGHALAQAVSTETVFVGGGSYNENVTLSGGISIVGGAFSGCGCTTTGAAIVDGGSNPAITADATAAGAITGLTIRSAAPAMSISGNVNVNHDVFDQGSSTGFLGTVVEVLDASPRIGDNVFSDPTPTDAQNGITSSSGASMQVTNNSFSGYNEAILTGGASTATPTISGNDIAGTHSATGAGVGIGVINGTAMIAGNRLHDPVYDPATQSTTGIAIFSVSASNPAADLTRNRVIGFRIGVSIEGTSGALTMKDDLIAKSFGLGLFATDPLTDAGDDVTATNVTIVDSIDATAHEIVLDHTTISLNSGIVGDKGVKVTSGGCTSNLFSRGPSTGDCTPFTTTASPMFVNAAANDYRLQGGSPLIDAGDPSDPGGGETDLDGDPRAMDGPDNGSCYETAPGAVVRDIGADEFNCPPNSKLTANPHSTTTRRHVKFKFTADDPAATFACKIDSRPFHSCSSPKRYTLGRGRHKFRVRAIDAQRNADPTPAKKTFRII